MSIVALNRRRADMAEFMTIELCSIVGRREKRRMPGIHIYKRIWRNWQTR